MSSKRFALATTLLFEMAVCHGNTVSSRLASVGRTYTENFLCKQRFCTNPIFPGLMQFGTNILDKHANMSWTCMDHSPNTWRDAGFCSQVVSGYSFAVPTDVVSAAKSDPSLPTYKAALQRVRIEMQEKEAVQSYVAHLSAMGHDFWDYTKPWEHDECIQAVWKMACYTYFPRCNNLNSGQYLRPCASSCQDYLKQCRVECCDEGVQCVFSHIKAMPDGSYKAEEGYVAHSGPSPLCTGAASRISALLLHVPLALALWVASASVHRPGKAIF